MRITLTLVIVALSLPFSASLSAQSRATFVPSISVSSVHDDNLFSKERAVGDLMTQLRPSAEGTYESPTLSLQGLFEFDMQVSAQHAALNTFDARRHGIFEGSLRSTPSLTFGLAGRYDQSETPGELNFESAVLHDRRRAQRLQFTPSIAYRLGPRTRITSRYDWTTESLDGGSDGDLHIARVSLARDVTSRTTLSAGYLGRLFEGAPRQHHSQAALLGWSWKATPMTTLELQAGPRMTSYRGVTAEVLAAVMRRSPRTSLLVDYWQGESIILGILGPVAVQSATMRFTWTVKRAIDLGAAVGAFESTTIDHARARVVHASLVGAWRLGDLYTLTARYGADFQQGDIRSRLLVDERVRRGVFVVRLTVAPRLSRLLGPSDDPMERRTPLKGAR